MWRTRPAHEFFCLAYCTCLKSAVCDMAWKVVIACKSLGLEALFPGSESMSQESFLLKSGWKQRLEDGVLEPTSTAKELRILHFP